MNEYKITLTAHYEKTVFVLADSPEQAREKMETILFDTNLIDFTDEDFICGEAVIIDANEDDCEEAETENENLEDDCCLQCPHFCPECGACMYEDEE